MLRACVTLLWTASKTARSSGSALPADAVSRRPDQGDVPALGYLPGRTVRFPLQHRDHDGTALRCHTWAGMVAFPAHARMHPCWAGVADGSAFLLRA